MKTVFMTNDAINNYGEQWRGVALVITHSANKYMPAKEFFANGKPDGYHPGYDDSIKGEKLYDLKRADTSEALNMSLYAYEVQS